MTLLHYIFRNLNGKITFSDIKKRDFTLRQHRQRK
uniref:Uncharacterized protein n=1 Tax=Rhizophora mucronata TaxID=61149 RepID=A0A2P2KZZ3_RHIMU